MSRKFLNIGALVALVFLSGSLCAAGEKESECGGDVVTKLLCLS